MNPQMRIVQRVKGLDGLLGQLSALILEARQQVLRAADIVQVRTCWQVGRHIVEFEQKGAGRAKYGAKLLNRLAERLMAEFGKGFDERNLRHMRAFFQAFPIWNALRTELSWTHSRTLLQVENRRARKWYMLEAAKEHLSTRALERQISTLYYERLLASRDRRPLRPEAAEKLNALEVTPRDFVRDPVVLEFLGLPNTGKLLESNLEEAMRLYDGLRRGPEDNPTVGIILCARKDASVVRYSVLHGHEQLFATKYKLVLPSEQELRAELLREQRLYADGK